MDKKTITEALQKAKTQAKKRNFSQSVEFTINFRGLDLKNPDHQQDYYITLKHPLKKKKVCGFVDSELTDASKKHFDKTITLEEFSKFQDKKAIKKLAREYDYFVAQATIMPKVAQTFGRYLGPVNKMPNPKAGCVVPPNANLEALKKRLDATVRVFVKSIPMFQTGVGKEDTKDEAMVEDIMTIYDQVLHHLPAEHQNIKSMYVKLTMGKPVRLDGN